MVRGSAAAVADLGSRILKKGAAASRGGSRIAGRGSRRISADLGGSRAMGRGARRFTIARGRRAVADLTGNSEQKKARAKRA